MCVIGQTYQADYARDWGLFCIKVVGLPAMVSGAALIVGICYGKTGSRTNERNAEARCLRVCCVLDAAAYSAPILGAPLAGYSDVSRRGGGATGRPRLVLHHGVGVSPADGVLA